METENDIKTLSRKASITLLDTKRLLEILIAAIEGREVPNAAILTLSGIILNNINSAFGDIENCRKIITID